MAAVLALDSRALFVFGHPVHSLNHVAAAIWPVGAATGALLLLLVALGRPRALDDHPRARGALFAVALALVVGPNYMRWLVARYPAPPLTFGLLTFCILLGVPWAIARGARVLSHATGVPTRKATRRWALAGWSVAVALVLTGGSRRTTWRWCGEAPPPCVGYEGFADALRCLVTGSG